MTNQTVTTGSAPALSTTYDPATNRQTGECADANGNLNSAPTCWNQAMYYDVENRPVKNSGYLAWAYSYAPGNKRVWRGVWDTNNTQTVDEVTFWGVNGQKLTTYSLSMYYNQFVATSTGSNYYFGGKLIKNATGYVGADRIGSIGKYFPYGQERPSATQDGKEKFATYFRDSETGLDYAQNRYHQPGMGRFMTPDPYGGSAKANDPESWNRYPYSGGDPVNNSDPSGLDACTDFLILEENPEAGMSICGGSISDLASPPAGGSVFAYDLGQVGPGSGNSSTAFSGAYDLNNGAPGFGGNLVSTGDVTAGYQLACQYATNPCTSSDSVNARNRGGTVNVVLNRNPLDPSKVSSCWLDPLTFFHPEGPSYYCGGNLAGKTGHLVDDPNGTGAHYDDPGPLNPLHWVTSIFAWFSDPSSHYTCSVDSGCYPSP